MGSLSHERKYDTFAPPSSPCALKYIEHYVSKLDTLAGVAIKYGVEIVDIKRTNGLTTDLQLFAHKILLIPIPGKHPPSTPIQYNGSLDDRYLRANYLQVNIPPEIGELRLVKQFAQGHNSSIYWLSEPIMISLNSADLIAKGNLYTRSREDEASKLLEKALKIQLGRGF
ncbi:lysM and putative peptidoglycan-binding domain-containing protein 2-like [Zingiber officinale]|uniref:lysM and putative peptidoglycan-binding domain-containing protein 2-like n=1 Tax=Zingiber officinale TaxID=94328 RepID=UPI001C4D325C|nr:lysM and putative peptidoglycan-binding domain-containing protein 2-like [Zingiber officinale]